MGDAFELAEKIAVELGEGWSAEAGVWGHGEDAWLNGPDDVAVRIIIGGPWNTHVPAGRVKFWGTVRDEALSTAMVNRRGKHTHREITASLAKSPEKLAKDVSSRLLPHARAYAKEAREVATAAANYEADLRAFTSAIRAANPAFHPSGIHNRDDLPDTMLVGAFGDKYHGEMRIYAGEVEFTRLNMSRKEALMFAEWMWRRLQG